MLKGLLTMVALAALPAQQSMAQYYQPPGYPPPPPPGYGYPDRRGGPYEGRIVELQRQRNRRVLALQEQLNRGQIGRREFNEDVREVDREMNAQIYGR